jgi:predicted membrane metal-binding protein
MVEHADGVAPERDPSGPDPIYGLALLVVGILTMGVAGAATLHFVFNAGTALTILGALMFVASLAISSLKDSLRARREKRQLSKPPASADGAVETSSAPPAAGPVEASDPPND